MKYDRCAQMMFGIFSFVFFVTRLIIYPFFLLWSVLFEYPVVISHSPAWWIMVIMLVLLQVHSLQTLRIEGQRSIQAWWGGATTQILLANSKRTLSQNPNPTLIQQTK